jgi:hypothetical protein
MSEAVISRAPLPKEALEQYEGKWIAIQAERVVAAAETLEELLKLIDGRRDVAVYRVPESDTFFY